MSSWQDNKNWQNNYLDCKYDGIWFNWIFALVWLGISSPAVFVGIPELLKKGEHLGILVILIFPVVGVFLVYFAVYRTLQKMKYGYCRLTLEKMPLSIGSHCTFKLSLPVKLQGTENLTLNLNNIRRVVSGSGKNRSTRHTVLWKTVKQIKLKNARVISGHLETEVTITIPYDCLPYDESNPSNAVLWRLDLNAATSGIDFAASFSLPVLMTEESDSSIVSSLEEEKNILLEAPKIKGMQIQEIDSGIRLFIKPFRFLSASFATFVFGGIFMGAGLAMLYYVSWFGLIFALVGMLILLISVHYLLIQTEIIFYQNKGQIKSTWLGLGIVKEFDLDEIVDIRTKVATQTTSDFSGDKCQYTIEIVPKEGKSLVLCDLTKDYSQALWIAAKLKSYLGLI